MITTLLQVYKVRVSPSAYFKAADVVNRKPNLDCVCTLWIPSCGCHKQTWVGRQKAGVYPDVPAW